MRSTERGRVPEPWGVGLLAAAVAVRTQSGVVLDPVTRAIIVLFVIVIVVIDLPQWCGSLPQIDLHITVADRSVQTLAPSPL
jgi:hypothetical protein